MNTWNLRTEILMAAHRWYWLVLSFFVGAVLGWLVSFVWPGPYRAVHDIYVGLNAHRATRDLYLADVGVQQFRNLDDYKNWQMEQLNSLALSDEFLDETLNRLQSMDGDWQDVDLPGLRKMLEISWRNTGDWHFSALTENPDQATQAVTIWSQVVTDETTLAVEAARRMIEIDSQMRAVSEEQVDLTMRQILLRETQSALEKWQFLLETDLTDQTLSPLNHWTLLSLVSKAADWSLGWRSIMESSPSLGSLSADYLAWLIQVRTLIESELSVLPAQIETLTREYEILAVEYSQTADESRALSGNMEVQQLVSERPTIEQVRPTSTLIIVGGAIGLLVLGIIWLVQVTHRTD